MIKYSMKLRFSLGHRSTYIGSSAPGATAHRHGHHGHQHHGRHGGRSHHHHRHRRGHHGAKTTAERDRPGNFKIMPYKK